MKLTQFDVVGIGNALVDVSVRVDEDFLNGVGIPKGSMTLFGYKDIDALYRKLPQGIEVSGGSAANTVVGYVSLGGQAAYIGKISRDHLGAVFRNDISKAGVTLLGNEVTSDLPTGHCLVMITPDHQRTMATYLGASISLTPDDLDRDALEATKIVYIEGYLYDRASSKEACRQSAEIVHAKSGRVAFTLSDVFCVERHRESFLALIRDHVDIMFANEAELLALTEKNNIEQAYTAIRGMVEIAVITRSAAGSVVITGSDIVTVPAQTIGSVEDTTGAGDLYAAGFLYGHIRNLGLKASAELGSLAAAEVISHMGARPLQSLQALLARTSIFL